MHRSHVRLRGNRTSALRRCGLAHVFTAAAWLFARAATSDSDGRKSRQVLGAYSCNKTEGSFDQPKGRDGADGVSRNVLAPCKSRLRCDVPSTELPGSANCHGDYRHHQAMKRSCPSSTPTLKKRSASGMAFCGNPTSRNAPAKPSPCKSPKLNAITHGHVSVRPDRP